MGWPSFLGAAALLAVGCGSDSPPPAASPTIAQVVESSRVITLGDIDAEDPVKKLKRFTPLANYLAEHLSDQGIEQGRVVIARDIEEMGLFLRNGTVDIYFDSPFPTLAVQDLSGSEILLRRWKNGLVSYSSTFVVRRDSGITRVDEFVGKILAVEEPASTSGFLLPIGTLIQRGFVAKEVAGPESAVSPDQIGYFFTGDEENTFELILQGKVAGGGVSYADYDELPAEQKALILAFDTTVTVPRQLVSVGSGLDATLVSKVRELLMALDKSDEGLQILDGLKKTKKFDPLPTASKEALAELKELIALVNND